MEKTAAWLREGGFLPGETFKNILPELTVEGRINNRKTRLSKRQSGPCAYGLSSLEYMPNYPSAPKEIC